MGDGTALPGLFSMYRNTHHRTSSNAEVYGFIARVRERERERERGLGDLEKLRFPFANVIISYISQGRIMFIRHLF